MAGQVLQQGHELEIRLVEAAPDVIDESVLAALGRALQVVGVDPAPMRIERSRSVERSASGKAGLIRTG